MATSLLTETSNPHINALKTAFAESKSPVEWLVITHNAPQISSALASALAGQSAAILEVSQDIWDFESQQFSETIEWALQQHPINNLVLVGDSSAGGPNSQAALIPQSDSDPNESTSTYSKLLAGAKRHNARNIASQKRFAAHVHQVSLIPSVASQWSSGDLTVHGLFHRADSGLFLNYDLEKKLFHPMFS